jgi:hypothetical protein
MEKLYKLQLEYDSYIRTGLLLLKICVLVSLFIALKPDINSYNYFKDTYNTYPQTFTVVGYERTLFDLGVLPYGLMQLKQSDPETFRLWELYYTNPMFRRDNDLAFKAVDKIKTYTGYFILFYILLFFLDLSIHNFAKYKLGYGSYKELWVSGLKRSLYLDGTSLKKSIEDLKQLKEELSFNYTPKDKEVHNSAQDKDKPANNFGKSQ